MTVSELSKALSLGVIAGDKGMEAEIHGCYIGDLLSWVMGNVNEANAWITIMGNTNAIAVAKLSEVACIILCEGAHLDDNAKIQADSNDVPVLQSTMPAYQLACAFAALQEATA